MRAQELLEALGRRYPGVEMHMGFDKGEAWASVCTLYEPRIRAVDSTLFKAAFQVSKKLIADPVCPAEVRKALEAYDDHTRAIQL